MHDFVRRIQMGDECVWWGTRKSFGFTIQSVFVNSILTVHRVFEFNPMGNDYPLRASKCGKNSKWASVRLVRTRSRSPQNFLCGSDSNNIGGTLLTVQRFNYTWLDFHFIGIDSEAFILLALHIFIRMNVMRTKHLRHGSSLQTFHPKLVCNRIRHLGYHHWVNSTRVSLPSHARVCVWRRASHERSQYPILLCIPVHHHHGGGGGAASFPIKTTVN